MAADANDAFSVLIGTYTTLQPSSGPKSEGIYRAEFDPSTGRLSTPQLWVRTTNPSWLALHPSLPVVYAAGEAPRSPEDPEGTVSAFGFDTEFNSTGLLGVQSSGGSDPCHLAVLDDGSALAVANYTGGTTALLPLGADGAPGSPRSLKHPGAASHAHWVGPSGTGKTVWTVDMGGDVIYSTRFSPNHAESSEVARLPGGTGPRHLVVHPSLPLAFSICELQPRVDVWKTSATTSWVHVQTLETLDAGEEGVSWGAEIALAPNGRFLYLSLRGVFHRIVCFEVAPEGTLTCRGWFASGGTSPRSIAISPDGGWLLAAHQDSSTIGVHRLNPTTGLGTLVQQVAAPVPVHLLMLPPADALPPQVKPGFEVLSRRIGLDGLLAGRKLRLERGGRGFHLTIDASLCRIRFGTPTDLWRALGRLAGCAASGSIELQEQRSFDKLGAMIDASRNAVPTVETVKTFLANIALMGYSTLLLYLEDTYEVPEYPYFGHLRGRYTAEDLRAIDDYAFALGIDVVPCIQTLAHVTRFLVWRSSAKLRDNADILLVGSEATYDFVRAMIRAAHRSLRSKRLHIGMDEAFEIGLGHYLTLHGYRNRFEILTEHLGKVVEICRDEGLSPLMWSDMFFRLSDPSGDYAAEHVPEAAARAIPPEVQLVYWDYFNTDVEFYRRKISQHEAMKPGTVFAGSVWTYNGMSVALRRTLQTTVPAARACREQGVREVLVTLWGDDGSETHFFHALFGLQVWAELAWGMPAATTDELDMPVIHQRFRACTGGNPEAFEALDRINNMLGLVHDPLGFNLGKLAFYQDVLHGMFDRHIAAVPLDWKVHYGDLAKRFEAWAAENNPLAFLFSSVAAYCRVLELKADLGVALKALYDTGQRSALADAPARITEVLNRVSRFHAQWRALWHRDFRPFGGEVLDIKMGALRARLEYAHDQIAAYVAGTVDRLPELEAPRLFFDGDHPPGAEPQLRFNRWHQTVTPGYLSHNVP